MQFGPNAFHGRRKMFIRRQEERKQSTNTIHEQKFRKRPFLCGRPSNRKKVQLIVDTAPQFEAQHEKMRKRNSMKNYIFRKRQNNLGVNLSEIKIIEKPDVEVRKNGEHLTLTKNNVQPTGMNCIKELHKEVSALIFKYNI